MIRDDASFHITRGRDEKRFFQAWIFEEREDAARAACSYSCLDATICYAMLCYYGERGVTGVQREETTELRAAANDISVERRFSISDSEVRLYDT